MHIPEYDLGVLNGMLRAAPHERVEATDAIADQRYIVEFEVKGDTATFLLYSAQSGHQHQLSMNLAVNEDGDITGFRSGNAKEMHEIEVSQQYMTYTEYVGGEVVFAVDPEDPSRVVSAHVFDIDHGRVREIPPAERRVDFYTGNIEHVSPESLGGFSWVDLMIFHLANGTIAPAEIMPIKPQSYNGGRLRKALDKQPWTQPSAQDASGE